MLYTGLCFFATSANTLTLHTNFPATDFSGSHHRERTLVWRSSKSWFAATSFLLIAWALGVPIRVSALAIVSIVDQYCGDFQFTRLACSIAFFHGRPSWTGWLRASSAFLTFSVRKGLESIATTCLCVFGPSSRIKRLASYHCLVSAAQKRQLDQILTSLFDPSFRPSFWARSFSLLLRCRSRFCSFFFKDLIESWYAHSSALSSAASSRSALAFSILSLSIFRHSLFDTLGKKLSNGRVLMDFWYLARASAHFTRRFHFRFQGLVHLLEVVVV